MVPRCRIAVIAAVLAQTALLACPTNGFALTAAVPGQLVPQPPEVVPPSPVPPPGAPLLAGIPGGLGLQSQILTLEFTENGTPTANTANEAANRGWFGRTFDTVAYWAGSLFTSITSGLTPPSPEDFAKGMRSKDPNDFWKLVGDAGYKLREITTDVGVFPDVGFRFKYVRELSDGDINWLERKLTRHAEKFQDPMSLIQRTIIYTLLSINSSDVYYVDELRVKLLPLPKAQFSLMPWDTGLSEEHDTLLRAIQGKKRAKRRPMEEDTRY